MIEFVEQSSFVALTFAIGLAITIWTATSTAVGFALERGLGDRRRIFDLPIGDGQLRRELIGTIRFVVMAAVVFAALLRALPFAEESTASVVGTFVFCWFGFEVYYWGLHRVMHLKPFYRFHKYHHESRVTSPLTGYSMSTAESAGWLLGLAGVPLLMSLFSPISLWGFILYHALYQVPGNVIGHANVDFFPQAASTKINSWISHPITYHSLHHARFNNHYSFGSTFMDRLLGTEWADWPELHTRITRGEPLEKLSIRGASNPST